MTWRALHMASLVTVGVLAAVLALLFLAPPLQPCSPGVGAPAASWCDPYRPAWLASLPPFDRFLVDSHDLMPVMVVGLTAVAVLVGELVWRLVDSRREAIGY